ncbi:MULTISPECIES: hypothetical protein [unclassified Maribacter]|uniref:hypothetical protein n=1 Tax=unclassified Maribacter TaxID=2615042 RepID=UPI002580A9A0|nr:MULTISPECIES: hypothetical protein [unclassified Maribacter]
MVDKVFDNIHYAYVTYVVAQGKMLITPVSSQWFVKMHEPTQFLLKSRNLKGDRTLAIREILIDNDLDTSDRVLHYEVVEKTNLIKIDM